jgi:hypothetical protein
LGKAMPHRYPAVLATAEDDEKLRNRGKLSSGGMEKDHLALQILKVVGVLGGLLFGEEVVLGIGQDLLPADLPILGAQRRAQPLKFITGLGGRGISSSGGAPAAAQGQDKNKQTKSPEKVHGTTLLYLRDYRKTPGSARWENYQRRNYCRFLIAPLLWFVNYF